MGRPAYQPTAEVAERVKELAAFGIDHDTIARLCQISDETMRKYYREELDVGKAAIVETVARSLVKMALNGDVQAAKFFLSSQGGWADRVQQQHTGEIAFAGIDREIVRPKTPPTDR